MVLNIGSLEILGAAIGVKEEISNSLEVSIIWVLSQLAHGQPPPTLGLKISEMKQNPMNKI